MKDPSNLLREAFDIYYSKKAPWEQSKAYFEKLKEFCDYSEKWRKEQEKTIARPHNIDAGETRNGEIGGAERWQGRLMLTGWRMA